MEEIIAKSKMYKALKAKQREEDEKELDKLNDEFKALVQVRGREGGGLLLDGPYCPILPMCAPLSSAPGVNCTALASLNLASLTTPLCACAEALPEGAAQASGLPQVSTRWT